MSASARLPEPLSPPHDERLSLPRSPGSSYPSPALQGTRPAKGLAASAFDRFKDAADVEQSLRDSCLACVQQILSHIRSELSSGEPRPDLGTVLFVARLCQSMGDLCTNLRRCVLGREGSSEAARETPRPGRKLGKAKAPAQVGPAQARWVGLRRDLGACSMDAYRIWSSALSQVEPSHTGRIITFRVQEHRPEKPPCGPCGLYSVCWGLKSLKVTYSTTRCEWDWPLQAVLKSPSSDISIGRVHLEVV